MRRLIVSFEGISGAGKTYLAAKFTAALRRLSSVVVAEVSNRSRDGIDGKILALLQSSPDHFFRMGFPLTETLLLMALKTFDYESFTSLAPKADVILEDRSVDSIAVYQTVITNTGDTESLCEQALALLSDVERWRPAPDLTFLILDDFDVAIARAEKRNGVAYTDDQLNVLRRAAALYDVYSKRLARMISVDRRSFSGDDDLINFVCREVEKRMLT